MAIPQLYQVQEVAQRLSVAPKTIIRAIKGGSIAAVKIGSAWRLSEDNVNEYLQKRSTKVKKY